MIEHRFRMWVIIKGMSTMNYGVCRLIVKKTNEIFRRRKYTEHLLELSLRVWDLSCAEKEYVRL